MRIVLASASPRRRELLAQIGLAFEVRVSEVEERISTAVPRLLVQELAKQKAEAVFRSLEEPGEVLVIGADTVVSCDDRILGKPSGPEQAREMLSLLQGRSHRVYTGVSLLYRPDGASCAKDPADDMDGPAEGADSVGCGKDPVGSSDSPAEGAIREVCFAEAADVSFFPMTAEEIDAYVDTGDPLDKAGAYGIQGLCARYISGIQGDYNCVVGLPVGRLYQEMKRLLQKGTEK